VLVIGIRYEGSARGKVHVYGISGGSRVITGTVTPPDEGDDWTATSVLFSPISSLNVDGFELELESGGDDPDTSGGSTITLNSFYEDAIVDTGSYTATWNVVQLSPTLVRGDYIIQIIDANNLLSDTVYLHTNLSTAFGEQVKMYHQFGGSPEMYWRGPYQADSWRRTTGNFQISDPAFWSGGGSGDFTIYFQDQPGSAMGTFVASGTIWFSTINVTPLLRKITLAGSQIHNVCANS
jgi:hypothetical protein